MGRPPGVFETETCYLLINVSFGLCSRMSRRLTSPPPDKCATPPVHHRTSLKYQEERAIQLRTKNVKDTCHSQMNIETSGLRTDNEPACRQISGGISHSIVPFNTVYDTQSNKLSFGSGLVPLLKLSGGLTRDRSAANKDGIAMLDAR